MMKNRKQKIYTYIAIIGLSIILGIASYPFHKTDKFKLFSKLIDKEEYRISIETQLSQLKTQMSESFNKETTICPELNKVISFEELNILISNECVLIIDARSGSEVDDEKINEDKKMIPNAVPIPVEEIELIDDKGYFEDPDNQDLLEELSLFYNEEMKRVEYLNLISKLNKYGAYIVYCGSKECDKSEILANYLIDNFQFSNVAVYKGGWEEWKERFND
tara:strand:- start:1642 stop:2301 length:660 start_codon:yes stop_codon:yes gene_type:complete